MITVHDPAVATRLRRLRQHAMDVSDLARHSATEVIVESYDERGFNSRMTDLQAALGLCQMSVLDEILERRRRLAVRYTELLEGVPGITPPQDFLHTERTWQSYCVRVDRRAAVSRTELMRRLLADGIATRRGVMAIHHERPYAAARRGPLPHTEAAAAEMMMLPLFPGLTEAEQDHVVERVTAHAVALAA